MKRKVLSLFTILSFGLVGLAQDDISITYSGSTTDLSGTTLNVPSEGEDLAFAFYVYNNSSTSKDWIITRKVISQTTGWQNEVCWGATIANGQCYPHYSQNVWTTPDEATIPAGTNGEMTLYIKPFNTPGVGDYMYYVSEDGVTYQDSIRITVSSTAAIKVNKTSVNLSLAPNPATNYINISANDVEKAHLKVVDVLGNVIISESFSGSKQINTENMRNGVYFVVLEGNGINTINRKFVVRH